MIRRKADSQMSRSAKNITRVFSNRATHLIRNGKGVQNDIDCLRLFSNM